MYVWHRCRLRFSKLLFLYGTSNIDVSVADNLHFMLVPPRLKFALGRHRCTVVIVFHVEVERDRTMGRLVLTTVNDSARTMFEVDSDRLGAVVGHK